MGEKKTTLLKKREFYYNIIIPRFFCLFLQQTLWIIYRILCNQLIKYK